MTVTDTQTSSAVRRLKSENHISISVNSTIIIAYVLVAITWYSMPKKLADVDN